ncbi:hypothetical protein L6452_10595 [Arctium lappa]|uniref:Uncharacterized protein n=1 Tax=Arctium lappa TaxID=4217 RepID=A0ACB9DMG3_ARCLA|nr:hypothetical protein L6452_10595 [Arctium lappa]
MVEADLQDRDGKLASWNEDDDSPCKWTNKLQSFDVLEDLKVGFDFLYVSLTKVSYEGKARRRNKPNDFFMHRNAELHVGRVSCNATFGQQPSRCTSSVVAMAIMGLCLASFWDNGY